MSASLHTERLERIRIAPQGLDTGDQALDRPARGNETHPSQAGDVVVAWEWDGDIFRLDARAPDAVALNIVLPLHNATIYANGATIWEDDAYRENSVGVAAIQHSSAGLKLACPSGGDYHILACKR